MHIKIFTLKPCICLRAISAVKWLHYNCLGTPIFCLQFNSFFVFFLITHMYFPDNNLNLKSEQMIHFLDFSTNSSKEVNFWDFMSAFLCMKRLLKKIYSKRKEVLPRMQFPPSAAFWLFLFWLETGTGFSQYQNSFPVFVLQNRNSGESKLSLLVKYQFPIKCNKTY